MKELAKLDKPVVRRILKAVDALGSQPRPSAVRQLVGFPGLCRIRVGDYLVVYIKEAELVPALPVAHRSEV